MKSPIILLIKSYKVLLSPVLPQSCRFVPTCSEYSIEAIKKYGTLRGSVMSAKRILKCHPFHPGGYDPVK
ncbi:MAG: membrane protein insertion efficiency factor YidD [Nitrospirae bacterium]|nr:membrane protein insertion efficiency factor YidD [Nitrospirota bacterium]HDH02113.1 membrane protein insertion efficiency factor YidD [Nitrospirota bacterium]